MKHKAHIAYPNDLDLAIFKFKNTQFKPDSIELTKSLLSHKDACDSLEEKLEEKPANNLLTRVLTCAHLRPSDEQRNLAFDIARLLIEHGENLAALATNSTGKTTTIIKLAKKINPKFHQLLKQAPLIRNEFIAAKTRQTIAKDALSSHSFPT